MGEIPAVPISLVGQWVNVGCRLQIPRCNLHLAKRLSALDDTLQERLINRGYTSCDAALRSQFDPSLALPKGFPYPDSGV